MNKMEILNPLITTLPFYKIPPSYVGGLSPQINDPFYFQKAQCEKDCFFGTITTIERLPPFIVRMEKEWNVDASAEQTMVWQSVCANGVDVIDIVPEYRWEFIAFITSADLPLIVASVPTIGDTYLLDDGFGDVEFYVWNGGGWNLSGQIVPVDGDLVNVTSEGFVYVWNFEDTGNQNPARNGSWIRTINGMQLCDIGDYTYLIYSGFKVTEDGGAPLPCGLRQINIDFGPNPNLPDTPTNHRRWMSELVDFRDFDENNNEYHRLDIDNDCALGNIPYADIRFSQWYYFHKDTLVGEPSYDTEQDKEEDGLGKEILTFSRTSKTYTLETKLVPEYIIDFLNFAGMHDSIAITFPYSFTNKDAILSQYQGPREIDRNNYSTDEDWLDSACYATVNMQFGLTEDIIDTNCCQTVDKEGCIVSTFEVQRFICPDQQDIIENGPASIGDCFIIKDMTEEGCISCDPGIGEECFDWYDHQGEIACWNGTGWDYTIPTENLIITNLEVGNEGEFIYVSDLVGWKLHLSVECNSNTITSININAWAAAGVITVYLYYRRTGTFNWILDGVYTAAQLRDALGHDITGLAPCGIPYDIRILATSNNCNYGYGAISECVTGTDETC